MFSFFENFLKPTETPEHPEPPGGLTAFLWHFARQAKALFVALFVIEFLVALTDSAVPWFMGRIVTFVSHIPPAQRAPATSYGPSREPGARDMREDHTALAERPGAQWPQRLQRPVLHEARRHRRARSRARPSR